MHIYRTLAQDVTWAARVDFFSPFTGWNTFFQFEIPHLYFGTTNALVTTVNWNRTTPEYKRQGSDASEALPLALRLFRI